MSGKHIYRKDTGELVYFDCTLQKGDVALLRGKNWLNDNCILFWFEALRHRLFKQHTKRFTLVQPAAAFMLQFLPLEDLLVDTPDNVFVEMSSKELVLVPVVGSANMDKGGGKHWSLVVLENSQRFYHLDSSPGLNANEAQVTIEKMRSILERNGKNGSVVISAKEYPTQRNSYDCGVYVLATAEFLLDAVLNAGRFELPKDDKHVVNKRAELLEYIQSVS